MSQITEVSRNRGKNKDRVYVHIDNEYCASIRERTWQGMGLSVGSQITCTDLKEQENFFWKNAYGQSAWDKEKVRIDHIKAWFKNHFPDLTIDVTGFGADTNELIAAHPEEHGVPDLTVLSNTGKVLMLIEVTGTEHRRGDDYWIRPDKIEYIQNHSDTEIWIAMHFADTNEVVWIKPSITKEYQYVVKNIRGADEHYVIFDNSSKEVKSEIEFTDSIKLKL